MEAEEERLHQRRSLRLSEVFDGGCEIAGYLEPIVAAKLRTALDGVLGPRVRGDQRRPDQRRADGFDQLLDVVLDSGRLPVRGGQRPHLTVTATVETLNGDPGAPAGRPGWGAVPLSGRAGRYIA